MTIIRLSLFIAVLAFVTGVSAQTTVVTNPPPASIVTVGTGFDYSRGDYGFASDTEVFSVPLNLGYEQGPWRLRASVPYLTIKGPATVIGGGGSAARPSAASESGVGDIYLGATYQFGPVVGQINFDTTVRVKLPTADEDRGLGTGETDLYGQLDMYRTFGAVTPFVTLGYAAYGDNATYQIEDGPYVSGGAHFRTSDTTVFTTALNWRHRFVPGGDAGTDVTVALTHDLDHHWQIMAYALKGFTDASPDFGGGLQANYRF